MRLLDCRVPYYGGLTFIDREGKPQRQGINVGDMWEFRGYIEGATKCRGIYMFPDITEAMFDKEGYLNFENSFSAFRSFKGNMNRQLLYDIRVYKPNSNLSFTTEPQSVSENRQQRDRIPRQISIEGKDYDLLTDFPAVDKNMDALGRKLLFVEVSCLDREQYVGMARPDLFIRLPERPFYVGYTKAIIGIAMVIFLVTMIGVTASTMVKGPIATILTFVLYLLSGKQTQDFMNGLLTGTIQGGGVFESIYRIIAQVNPTQPLPNNPAFSVMRVIDLVFLNFLWLCKQVIPNMKFFNMSEYVANGFDVPFEFSLLPSALVTLAFVIPCIMIGYFALRIRELESK
jgi:hypothetical protein